MGTVADKLSALSNTKAGIKAAITEKGQAVGDVFSEYPDAIRAIQTGPDTSDATAMAGDILSGKTAYGASGKLTGNIPTKSASDVTASGATVTVPAGYYASQVQKSVATATQATPSISVSSSGRITASATQSAGYVSSGTKSATKQLTTQAAKTVTPGKTSQTAVASGRYTTGAVTVAGDANLVSGNIKQGISIFGVTGTFAGGDVAFNKMQEIDDVSVPLALDALRVVYVCIGDNNIIPIIPGLFYDGISYEIPNGSGFYATVIYNSEAAFIDSNLGTVTIYLSSDPSYPAGDVRFFVDGIMSVY